MTEQDFYLRFKSEEGLRALGRADDKTYGERLSYELGVIAQMGFASYFLVLWDCIAWAKSQGIIIGPGRGSAAGSLVAYALGITAIDPIKWGLYLERFLNPYRISMPDIDTDVEMRRREEVIRYLIGKWGSSNVVQIGTTGTMKARLAVRDTARALGVDPETIDRYGKLIPEEARGGQGDNAVTLRDCMKPTPEFSKVHKEQLDKFMSAYDKDKVFHDVVNRAIEIEGLPKSEGVHPAGVIIWDHPVDSIIPLVKTDSGLASTQWSDKEVEGCGLVKYDYLGLRTLNVIQDAIDTVRTRTGIEINWDEVDEKDEMTFDLLKRGDCFGVFQLTEGGMRKFTKDFQPENIYDLATISALYRPGPKDNGSCDQIVKIRNGLIEPSFPIEAVRSILEPTSGLMCFQEQILEIAKVLAGYTIGEADLLRRAIGKKIPSEMAAQRDKFVSGCMKSRLSKNEADNLFDSIDKFANYSFNLSHAVAYSVLSFRTAYLKAHYPADFYAAHMTNQDELDKIVPFILDARAHSISVLSPDINESGTGFIPIDNFTIRFGLTAVRDCGDSAIDEIVSNRKSSPYKDMLDFCKRTDASIVRKNNIASLVKAGAFDVVEPELNRFEMVGYLESIVNGLKGGREAEKRNQITMFDTLFTDPTQGLVFAKPKILLDKRGMLEQEKEVLGLYISDSPLSTYRSLYDSIGLDRLMDIDLPDLRVRCLVMVNDLIIRQAKNGEFAILVLEDETGVMPAKMWNNVFMKYQGLISVGQCLVVSGKTNIYRGLELNIDSVVLAETEMKSLKKGSELSSLPFEKILALSTSPIGNTSVDLQVAGFRYRLGFIP